MRPIIVAAAIAALAAGSGSGAAASDEATPADGTAANLAPANWSINETSWEFTQDGMTMQNSIDADGNYVINAGSRHIDHGTAVMKDGKVCTTSAMTQEGEVCWSVPALDIGASGEVVGSNGVTILAKRVAYTPPAM